MPIYEYKCKNCENKFTKLFLSQPNENDLFCEECGSKELTRLFSAFAIGSGKDKSETLPCGENKSANTSCGSGCGCCALGSK